MTRHRFIWPVVAISLLVFAPLAWTKEAKAVFKVSGMSCEMCAKGVEAQLAKLPGVKSAKVSFKGGRATIIYDDSKITVKQLKETIQRSGFGAELETEQPKASSSDNQAQWRSRPCCGVCPIRGAMVAGPDQPVEWGSGEGHR